MNVEARVEPLTGSLPSIGWRWDPETDILSGAFKGNRKSGGLTGTVELTDAEGSVAVLDVNNGVICGLDVVVWPEVTTSPEPAGSRHASPTAAWCCRPGPPGPVSRRWRWTPPSRSRPTVPRACSISGSVPAAPVEVVRVADNFYIEVDQQGGLAGFWLANVPPFTAFEDEM